MYTVVEQWTPKQAFLDAPLQEREALFARVGDAMPTLEAAGVTCLGWSGAEDAPHVAGHSWFAVWQMSSRAAVTEFFRAVFDAGWYDYFDQVNTVGTLAPIPSVLGELMGLPVGPPKTT